MTYLKSSLSILASFLVLLAGVAPLSAQGAEKEKAPGMSVPLARFMTSSEPIRLRYTSDEYSLVVPLSSRLKVNAAILHLRFVNSISLIRERSQLAVRMNGRLLAQVPLNPQQPETAVDIIVPANLLKVGYNKLTFAVAQHYTLRCEDPSAPELWTEIDTVASTLNFDAEPTRLNPRLSDMAKLFDPKSWGDQTLTIVTASNAPLSDEQLQWGALVSQGAALHLRYVPLRALHQRAVHAPEATSVRLSSSNFPGLQQQQLRGSDIALIGTKAELAPFLSKQLLDNIVGSFLGVYPLDADPSKFVLLVSGTTAAEIAQAANAFALLGFPYPDSASMRVTAIEYPRLADYSQKSTLLPHGTIVFSQLGYKTTSVKGSGVGGLNQEQHGALELDFIMPADLFAHEDSNVDLLLHFAYGASLRKDSVLNIILNDRFERAIPLGVETGAIYHKYQVSVPLRSFQPGPNRIKFVPRMMPLITGDCQAIQSENLLLTLYADSVIKMPEASNFVAMPNFRLLGRAGFPYSVKAHGGGTQLHVASNDSNTVGSAWTLIAKLGQRNGAPLREALVSFALPSQQDRDLIVVGSVGKIQGAVLKGAPLELGELSKIPYRMGAGLPNQDAEDNWLGWPKIQRNLQVAAADGFIGPIATVTQSSALTNSALAMQYESPFFKGRTATVFVAADENVLLEGIIELIKPEIWNDLQGNVVVWNKGADSVSWQKVGNDYSVGTVTIPARLEFYFSKYPWIWFAVLLALVTMLAVVTTMLVRRFRRSQHPEA